LASAILGDNIKHQGEERGESRREEREERGEREKPKKGGYDDFVTE